jgi:hypothetical protein
VQSIIVLLIFSGVRECSSTRGGRRGGQPTCTCRATRVQPPKRSPKAVREGKPNPQSRKPRTPKQKLSPAMIADILGDGITNGYAPAFPQTRVNS